MGLQWVYNGFGGKERAFENLILSNFLSLERNNYKSATMERGCLKVL